MHQATCSIVIFERIVVMSRRQSKVPPPPKKSHAQLQAELRTRRKGSYHLLATRNHLSEGNAEDDLFFSYLTRRIPATRASDRQQQIQMAKEASLRSLSQHAGDATTPEFQRAVADLTRLYDPISAFDARQLLSPTPRRPTGSLFRAETMSTPRLEGMWISLQRPRFENCLGTNSTGDYLYTLSRMTFGMLRPGNLVCSIQGTFNPVHVVGDAVSKSDTQLSERHMMHRLDYARLQVGGHEQDLLRSYDVVTAFTIEPRNSLKYGPIDSNQEVDRPVEGLLTTKGFALPDPDIPNRLIIWFIEGSIEVVDADDQQRWKRIFDSTKNVAFDPEDYSRRGGESLHHHGASVLASGRSDKETATIMEPDGRISFKLSGPIGGRETSYIDVMYLDESMRVVKSNRGDVYIFARLPPFPDE